MSLARLVARTSTVAPLALRAMSSSAPAQPLVLSSRSASGKVALLKLNRPEALNALNSALVQALNAELRTIEAEQDVGCVVLTGEGRAFAGACPALSAAARARDGCRLVTDVGRPLCARLSARSSSRRRHQGDAVQDACVPPVFPGSLRCQRPDSPRSSPLSPRLRLPPPCSVRGLRDRLPDDVDPDLGVSQANRRRHQRLCARRRVRARHDDRRPPREPQGQVWPARDQPRHPARRGRHAAVRQRARAQSRLRS